MRVKQFLHNLLSTTMHLKRLNTLFLLVDALLKDKKLSVTRLGRSLKNTAQEKNNIKKSDRFLSNERLHAERMEIYKATAYRLINTIIRPLIVVDWSPVPNTTHCLLRASLVIKGRALSVYEEVHLKKYENSVKAHKQFLSHLKTILPQACKPILITDAGFRNPWFRLVLNHGWDYVGRVKGRVCYQLLNKNEWEFYSDSHKKAQEKGVNLGEGKLAKVNPLKTFLYLIKLSKKNRVRLNKYKKKGNHKKDKENSKSANEPWLLASSLQKHPSAELDVFKIYYKRMQIEQNFRDLKSSQYGFSFEHAYSKNIDRIQILLLIAMIATLIAYITGLIAETLGWNYQFQANTCKKNRVLSLFYLGCQVLKKKNIIPIKSIKKAFLALYEWIPCAV